MFLISTVAFSQNAETKFVSQNNTDFAKTMTNDKVQVIDVRTPNEFKSGHIPKSINIDVNSPDFDNRAILLDKKYPVAVYCRSGGRSKVAAKKLSAWGFKVYELDKGIVNWNGEIEN